MQWSWLNNEYSRHQVQHTPSTAYTKYSIHRVLHHPMIDCLLLPASPISRQTVLYSTLYIPTITSFPMNRVTACRRTSLLIYRLQINHLQILLQSRLIMASKCIANVTWSLPTSASPNSLDQDLQVHLWVTQSRPPSASPTWLNHGLPVHLLTRSITTCMCISELHNLGLQVHFQTRLITGSKCISQFNLISASKCISELLDLGLQMHLQTHSITAAKFISWVTRFRPPNASPNRLNHGR